MLNKLRKYAWHEYCRSLSINHPLKYLYWETTLRCNLNCLHCGSNCPRPDTKDELTKDELIDFFNYIGRIEDFQKTGISITGGEPLLRDDLFDITRVIRDNGFNWGMVTNGTLVNKEVVAKCQETGMYSVVVSIDGDEETHNRIRQAEIFSKCMESISLFAQVIPVVEIVTTVNKLNISLLDKLHAIVNDSGANLWRIVPITPIGRAKQSHDLLMEEDDYINLLNWIREKRKENSRVKPLFCEEGYLPEEYELKVRQMRYYCFAGKAFASILYNGDISGCPNMGRNMIEGNIRKNDFLTVWQNEFSRYRNREWMRESNSCTKCKHWKNCEGNNLHLWNWDEKKTYLCYSNIMEREPK